MLEPGQRLRRTRERLRLRYRDVEEASQRIAHDRGNHEFVVGLSRLADIENKGTVPSIYRAYSLAAIYGLDFSTVLGWYGIPLEELPRDAARVSLTQTHLSGIKSPPNLQVDMPTDLSAPIDLRVTSYLSRHVQRWGKLPVALLGALDLRNHRYGFIGTEDWSMYPILPPGSFIQVDESRRTIVNGGWLHESERPIYFLEHRDGYRVGWCTEKRATLIVLPHSSSAIPPDVFRYPGDVDVVGQVVAVAMRLDLGKRRHTHSRAVPK